MSTGITYFLDVHYECIYPHGVRLRSKPLVINHNHEMKDLASYMPGDNLAKGDDFLLCKLSI